jgi:hypothetical protein
MKQKLTKTSSTAPEKVKQMGAKQNWNRILTIP